MDAVIGMTEMTVLIQDNGLIRDKESMRIIWVVTERKNQPTESKVTTPKFVVSSCICGMAYVIEEGADGADRPDGKRVYPLGMRDEIYNSFECRNCARDITQSVPGAEIFHG